MTQGGTTSGEFYRLPEVRNPYDASDKATWTETPSRALFEAMIDPSKELPTIRHTAESRKEER